MIHRPFLRSAIQVVGDFRIGDFDLQPENRPLTSYKRLSRSKQHNLPRTGFRNSPA